MRKFIVAVFILVFCIGAASAIVDNVSTMYINNLNGTHLATTSPDGNTSLTWTFQGDAAIKGLGSQKFGSGAVALDGTGDYLESSGATLIDGNYTVEFWANATAAPVFQPFFHYGPHSGQGLMVRMDSQYAMSVFHDGAQGTFYFNIPLNKYHHFAFCKNGSTMRIFMNGTYLGAFSAPGPIDPGAGASGFNIGEFLGTTWPGHIDDFRVSKKDLVYASISPFPVPLSEYVFESTTPPLPTFSANQTTASVYAMAVQLTNNTPEEPITASTYEVANFSSRYSYSGLNPTVLIPVAGNYTINATFTNASGSYVLNRSVYINMTSDEDVNMLSRIQYTGPAGSTYIFGTEGVAWLPSSVAISSTQSKFNGTSGSYLSPTSSLSTPSNTRFNFGAGDFSIEQWVYPLTTGTDHVIVSRSSSTSFANGWGLYHGAGAGSTDWHFYMGDRAANATTAFSIPLNQWSLVNVERKSGNLTVYVNGALAAQRMQHGPYDVSTSIIYGDPGVGLRSFDGYIDESGISNVVRFGNSYQTPLEQYHGDLYRIDPNPQSTLRFKTIPSYPSQAVISNLTPRNRTLVIENVNIANNISTTITYNPLHLYVKKIRANESTFTTGINFTKVTIDPSSETILINLTRPGGFSSPGGAAASVADIELVYTNYSSPPHDDPQYFGVGFLKNTSLDVDYPIRNFIEANMTYLDWVTYSNFTVQSRLAKVDKPVKFVPFVNYTADMFLWDFGDGTIENTTLRSANHSYMSVGDYTVICKAILSGNTSVTNTTALTMAVNVTLSDDTVVPEFSGYPTTGNPALSVTFTDLSTVVNKTALIYNWSFGDGSYSDTIGSVVHVYPYAGAFTVNLSITNTAKNETGFTVTSNYYERKTDYIVVSSQQQYTPEQRQVRFLVVDRYNRPLPGVNVYANVTGTTLGSVEWLTDLFGISSSLDPYISNATLSGITGSDGGIAFTMVPSLYYNLEFKNSSAGIQHTMNIYPNQLDYVIVVATTESAQIADKYNYVNHSLTTHDFGATVSLNFSYNDTVDPSTTSLTFFVNYPNYTPLYSVSYPDTLGSNSTVNGSYTVANTAGTAYVWGIYATNTAFGNINQSKGITLNGNGPMIDLFTFRSSW